MSDSHGRDDFDLTRPVVTEVDFHAGRRATDSPEDTRPDADALGGQSLLGHFTAAGATATGPPSAEHAERDASAPLLPAAGASAASLDWRHPADDRAAARLPAHAGPREEAGRDAFRREAASRPGGARRRSGMLGAAAGVLILIVLAAAQSTPASRSPHRLAVVGISAGASSQAKRASAGAVLPALSQAVARIAGQLTKTAKLLTATPAAPKRPARKPTTRRHAFNRHHRTVDPKPAAGATARRGSQTAAAQSTTAAAPVAPTRVAPVTSGSGSPAVVSSPTPSTGSSSSSSARSTRPPPAYGQGGMLGAGHVS